jgi:hypothetical protein
MGYAVKLHSGNPGQKATYALINDPKYNSALKDVPITPVDPNKPFFGTSAFFCTNNRSGIPGSAYQNTYSVFYNDTFFNNYIPIRNYGVMLASSYNQDYGGAYAYIKTKDNYNDFILPNTQSSFKSSSSYPSSTFPGVLLVTSFDTELYKAEEGTKTITIPKNFNYAYIYTGRNYAPKYNGTTISTTLRGYNASGYGMYDALLTDVKAGDTLTSSNYCGCIAFCFDQL